MNMRMKGFNDEYLQTTEGVRPPNCIHPFDFLKRQPKKSLNRTYEMIEDRKQTHLPKYPTHVLTQGSAVGLNCDQKVCHFYPDQDLIFLGFLEGQSEDQAAVWVRGSVSLYVEGADEGSRGQKVYCSGPDSFSLRKSRGSAEIGIVRFSQNGRCNVFFRREGDPIPCDLHIT